MHVGLKLVKEIKGWRKLFYNMLPNPWEWITRKEVWDPIISRFLGPKALISHRVVNAHSAESTCEANCLLLYSLQHCGFWNPKQFSTVVARKSIEHQQINEYIYQLGFFPPQQMKLLISEYVVRVAILNRHIAPNILHI